MVRPNTCRRLVNVVWLVAVCLALAGMRSASPESLRLTGPADPSAPVASFKGWSTLGKPSDPTTYLYAPVRGVNADARQEMFALSPFVWHAWQTSINGSWSGWVQHGYLQAMCLAVRPNADGRMELFALEKTGYSVWHTWQTAPNAPFASDPLWQNFGWPPGGVLQYCPLAAGQHADGRIDLFVPGGDGNLWSMSQAVPSGGWASWYSIGKPNGVTIYSPAWGFDSSGHQFVFVQGGDNAIYMAYQVTPSTDNWTWYNVSKPSGVDLGAPAVGWNNDGRLEIFAIGNDGNLWHRWQVAPSGWSAWDSMGHPSGAALYMYNKPVVGRHDISGTGWKMEVFAQSFLGEFWHIGQVAPSDGWGSWSSLGWPPGGTSTTDATRGNNADGSLVLFADASDGAIWQNPQGPDVNTGALYLPLLRK